MTATQITEDQWNAALAAHDEKTRDWYRIRTSERPSSDQFTDVDEWVSARCPELAEYMGKTWDYANDTASASMMFPRHQDALAMLFSLEFG